MGVLRATWQDITCGAIGLLPRHYFQLNLTIIHAISVI